MTIISYLTRRASRGVVDCETDRFLAVQGTRIDLFADQQARTLHIDLNLIVQGRSQLYGEAARG